MLGIAFEGTDGGRGGRGAEDERKGFVGTPEGPGDLETVNVQCEFFSVAVSPLGEGRRRF